MPCYNNEYARGMAQSIGDKLTTIYGNLTDKNISVNVNLPIHPSALEILIEDKIPNFVNNGILFFSLTTAGRSFLGYIYTQDPIAKAFFTLGFLCSSAATATSGTAALTKACDVNNLGLTCEVVGEGFCRLGNKANTYALLHQKKLEAAAKNRNRLRRFISSRDARIAFTPSHSGQPISQGTFMKVSVCILTLYTYKRITIASYQLGQQILFKLRRRKNLKLLKMQAKHLVNLSGQSKILYKSLRIKRLVYYSFGFINWFY